MKEKYWKNSCLLILVIVMPFYGCVTNSSTSRDNQITAADLDARENNRKLDKLSNNIKDLTGTIGGFQNDIRFLREELDRLKERVDKSNVKVSALKGKYREGDIVKAPPLPIETLQEKQLNKSPGSVDPDSGVKVAALQPRDYYHNAYDDYRFGEYESAIENFRKFVDHYPDDDLADNAQYWIGEMYYKLGDFKKATEEFAKVYENYPQGNKVGDAKLKYALCLYDMKEIDRCFSQLEDLAVEYEGGRIGETALQKLQKLRK